MDLVYKFVLLAIAIALVSSENCEPVTIDGCLTAGYGFTARFPDVDGQPYQDTQAPRLNIYIPLLQSCSAFASTILCSLYVPKCEEGRNTPWIPCRKVCSKFVTDCSGFLRKAGLAGLFITLCDLLPDESISQAKNCFYPDNFKNSSSGGPSTNFCYNITHQKCKKDLHYSKTFIPTDQQNAMDTIFQPIISSQCSTELEKFLCYTQFPPCYPNRPSTTSIPCKSLCHAIDKKCWKEFNKAGFPLPHCDFIYPNDAVHISETGLCNVTQWPASWPKEFRPAPYPLGTCEEITVKSCANAGYKFTAKFGKPFQESKGKLLDALLPHLQSCSTHSSLILCSLFLPKCIQSIGRPMLPCRQVCMDFADKCESELRLSSTHGMMTALCDLLPVFDGNSDKCIMPADFKSMSFSSRNVCYKVTSSKCSADLHYNNTFLSTEDQKASEFTILQSIIDSKCSPDIERYLCFTRMPQCTADTSVAHLPCREFCKRITRDCGDVFNANFIPTLHCDFLFPPGDSDHGQCDLKRWPAPWPWKIPDPVPPTSAGPAQCVPLTAKPCIGAGYDKTANFASIDGKPYQKVKSRNLHFFLSFLHLCSPYSKTIMCSLFLPKCVEGVERPILPCRSVCLEFVGKCQGLLSQASHAGLFRALCDLLPEQDLFPNTCFVPKGFEPTIPVVAKRDGTCSKVVKPQYCTAHLHYNQTFIPERNQSSPPSVLQHILNSRCSPEFEKYLCYTSVPPCKPNDLSVYVPCRDICEQVKRDCGREFKRSGIPLPDCSWLYPDESHPTGLCQLSKFPAPWPAKTKRVSADAGGKEQPQKAGNEGGVIAAVVILVFVVIAVVVIAAMYFRWRQGTKQFAAQRFENAEPEPRDVKL